MAITKFDQFDFLIDIVPRDELKPPKRQVRLKNENVIVCPFLGVISVCNWQRVDKSDAEPDLNMRFVPFLCMFIYNSFQLLEYFFMEIELEWRLTQA